MTYKLLIEIEPTFEKYSELLQSRELPSGEIISIPYSITNMSDKDFVGGILEEVSAEYAQSEGLFIFRYPKQKIPPIPKNTTITLYIWEATFVVEGLVWIECKITADDKDVIQYFQLHENNGGSVISEEMWRNYVIIKNRQSLDMLTLLKNIDENISKLVQRD